MFRILIRPLRLALAAPSGRLTLSLAGEWRFELDPNDARLRSAWFQRPLAGTLRLPATTATNHQGTPNPAVLCDREEIEAALRTRDSGGFELLDLQDYPGQGAALIGLLDAFLDSKGLITPVRWREFCSAVVPLLRVSRSSVRTVRSRATTPQRQTLRTGAKAIRSDRNSALYHFNFRPRRQCFYPKSRQSPRMS